MPSESQNIKCNSIYVTVSLRILLPSFKSWNKTDLLTDLGLGSFIPSYLGNFLQKEIKSKKQYSDVNKIIMWIIYMKQIESSV